MNQTSKLVLSLLVIAACGGSNKPPPAPANNAADGDGDAVTMDQDEVEGSSNEDEVSQHQAREQAIQAARDAGVLGNTAGSGAAPATQPAGDPRDKPAIRAVVQTIIPKITYCYEKQLLVKPGLTGTTTVHFTIAPDGSVGAATGDGFDTDVDTCVAGNFTALKFAVALDAGYVTVNYPFSFKPTP